MSRFSSQVPEFPDNFELLPVYHVCDGHAARDHVESDALIASDKCEVFKSKINYLFYGRPSFKYVSQLKNTKLLAFYPVCFVLNLNEISNIMDIYPFDTGALHHKLLEEFFHKNTTVKDFSMGSDKNRIRDIVLQYFGSNDAYLSQHASSTSLAASHFESTSYRAMISGIGNSKADERRITIEVQAGERIEKLSTKLVGMILPRDLKDDPNFSKYIDNNNIRHLTYSIQLWQPDQYFSVVAEKAEQLIREISDSEK